MAISQVSDLCFCTKHTIAERTGYSPHTLKKIRQRGEWIEGIHYVRKNSRVIRYNLGLCLDWFANQDNPQAHRRAIEIYRQSLPSNQPLKRGRKVG